MRGALEASHEKAVEYFAIGHAGRTSVGDAR
jgi:hypothetical protein